MLLPIACAAIYQESVGFYFALVACLRRHQVPADPAEARDKRFYAREGYVAVALAWIILPLLAATPTRSPAKFPPT